MNESVEHWTWTTNERGERVREPTPPPAPRPRPPPRDGRSGGFRWVVGEDGVRTRVPLTEDEARARDEARAAAEQRRTEERRLLHELVPTISPPGEAPSKVEHLSRMDERRSAGREVLTIERSNGSRLRVIARAFVGDLATREYLNFYTVYRSSNGLEYRTRGAAVYRDEMREVARILLEEATRLESGDEG